MREGLRGLVASGVLAVVASMGVACGNGDKSAAPAQSSGPAPASASASGTAPAPGSAPASATTQAPATTPAQSTTGAPAPAAASCDGIVSNLSLRDKLAQLLVVGVRGASDTSAAIADHIGGIFIGSDTNQGLLQDDLLINLEKTSKLPLMATIDEEGGRVSRFPNLLPKGPSARAIAQTMTPADVTPFAQHRGEVLKSWGITVDFAPDVDLTTQNPAIGDRSFGDDPKTVTDYAGAYIKGMQQAGIGTVIKHFPGHGHASGDSHLNSVTTPDLAQLTKQDLVPFGNLVHSGSAVMVGHLLVPGLTTDGLPTSLSPQTMRLVRFGPPGAPWSLNGAPWVFDGVIFTDDLGGMKAITDKYTLEQSVALALEAGADQALWTSEGVSAISRVLDHLTSEVNANRYPATQVDASVARVLRYKGKCS